ncbi:MAG: DUF5684 domain-containing protein [archaeon]|nr:DUF5684 domain-containing protein [archaeon]
MTGENFMTNFAGMDSNQQVGIISAIVALGIAIIIILLVLFVALYIYSAIALMTIAKKTKTKHAWMAWIPILNFYLVTQIAKQSGWWTLILLAGGIPFIGGIAIAAVSVWMFWLVAERRKFPGWFGILMLIPIVNLVILGILAWKKK